MCLDKKCFNVLACNEYDHRLDNHMFFIPIQSHQLQRIKYPIIGSRDHPEDKRILIWDCIINYELADDVRNYLKRIPVDSSLPHINDKEKISIDAQCIQAGNTGIKDMYKYYEILGIKTGNFLSELSNHDLQLIPFSKINDQKCLEDSLQEFINNNDLEAYKNVYNKHKEQNIPKILPNWIRYHNDFWRLSISDIEEYSNSPIGPLLVNLRIRLFNIYGSVISYIVIQLVEKGGKVAIHDDKNERREFAFIYYLTPDDCKGGELRVYDGDKYVEIEPKFNRLVSWKMDDNPPMHEVLENFSENRFSIVGFAYK